MASRVYRQGGNVRIVLTARGIVSTQIVGGFLFLTYSDGTVENAGPVGGGGTVLIPDADNTFANSSLIYANYFAPELVNIEQQIALAEGTAPTVNSTFSNSNTVYSNFTNLSAALANVQQLVAENGG